MSREAFAKWWGKDGIESPTIHETGAAWKTWKACQSEIDELRKAAEEVLAVFDSNSRYSTGFELAMERLRAALEKK